MITNIAGGYISMKYKFKGPNFCITSACASGTDAIGDGQNDCILGDADIYDCRWFRSINRNVN